MACCMRDAASTTPGNTPPLRIGFQSTIEHGNGSSRADEKMNKLHSFNAPLKVLITYAFDDRLPACCASTRAS